MGTGRFVISTVIIISLVTGLQAQRIHILENGGNQSAYFLSDIQKMSFSSGSVTVIKSDGDSFTYALTDILNLNYNLHT